MDPENHQFLLETSLPTPIYQGLCEFTGGYIILYLHVTACIHTGYCTFKSCRFLRWPQVFFSWPWQLWTWDPALFFWLRSGECDVSTFDENLNQKGEGAGGPSDDRRRVGRSALGEWAMAEVRYSKDRDVAYRWDGFSGEPKGMWTYKSMHLWSILMIYIYICIYIYIYTYT